MIVARRTVLAAGAAAMIAPGARAATSPFVGAVAANSVAQGFHPAPDGMELPDVELVSPAGPRRLRNLRGRTLLLSLWAEWCAPCLIELPDLAALKTRHDSDRFQVVAVLTGARKKMEIPETTALLAKVKAQAFEPLLEAAPGDRLLHALAAAGTADLGDGILAKGKTSLPCNLLVDPRGRVVARQFGLQSAPLRSTETIPANASLQEKMAAAKRIMAAGQMRSNWATPDGEAFTALLAEGRLFRR